MTGLKSILLKFDSPDTVLVEALGHAEMLRRDIGLEVLVETWL